MVGLLTRVLVSLLGGIGMYGVWLAALLAGMRRPPLPISFAVMLTAPAVTALGFGLGTLMGEQLTRGRKTGFLQAFLWPFIGCTAGALVVYPFGPMLIVFGVFALGTGAVLAREVWALRDGSGRRR